MDANVILRIIELLSVTFLGAWAGGHAAFAAERKAREDKERAGRISALNRALFKIAAMASALENVREYSLGNAEHRNHPERAFKIDSPQTGMLEAIRFNFDELSFLLDERGDAIAPALLELMTLEWKYTIFVRSIELRAEALAELYKAIHARPIANLNFQMIEQMFSLPLQKATHMTDQLIGSVNDGLQAAKDTYGKLVQAAARLFPGQEILQIDFQREPQPLPPRGGAGAGVPPQRG